MRDPLPIRLTVTLAVQSTASAVRIAQLLDQATHSQLGDSTGRELHGLIRQSRLDKTLTEGRNV